jgi:acetyl-CoA carboxylase carboxyltransferase component
MSSKHLGADFVFALPTAETAVMGPEGAANIIFKQEIASAPDPDIFRKQKVLEYTEKYANPYRAAASGYIDAVISPDEVREYIIQSLYISSNKIDSRPPKKHGIPPF